MPDNTVAMHAYGSGIFTNNYLTSLGLDLVASYAYVSGNGPNLLATFQGTAEVQQVIESSGDGIDVGMAETTHLKSPGRWREFVPGFKDGQQANIQVNYTEASYAELAAKVPQGTLTPPAWGRYIWRFVYPDDGWDAQVAFLKNLGKPRLADDRIVVDVSLKFSGPLYFFSTP